MSSVARALVGPAIRNVLVATDFSPCAESAMPTAGAIARKFHARIHLLHVLGRESTVGKAAATPLQQCEQALERLRLLSADEPFQDSVCHLIAQPGLVADIAHQCVRDLGIDLVVLGTHGRSGIKRVLIGSVAEEIIQRVKCGVVTVGPNVSFPRAVNGTCDTILFATRFGRASIHALNYAVAFARTFGSRIIALHVIENGVAVIGKDPRELIQQTKNHLEGVMANDIEREVVVRHGPAADWILKVASNRNADLIVMGAHAGIEEEVPWATTRRILRQAECPVLTATNGGTP